MDDQELNRLLREWTAPDAPPGLRPRRADRSWLRWLAAGTIRVPVPVAIALAVLLLTALSISARQVSLWPDRTSTSNTSRPGETPGPRPSGELARYALSGPLEGFDAVLVELNFPPGASAAAHRHPGPIVGYVVDGRMRFAINNETDQVVPAGGTFFEPPGVLHSAFGAASPDAPVRILAFLVVPTGSRLTDPA